MKRALLLPIAALLAACARSAAPHVPAVVLESTRGQVETFPATLAAAPWTVLVFFSADCPCFRAHEARLAELVRAYEPQGVRFILVDSEVGASVARAAELSRERGLSVPIVIDAKAVLADALDAEYATYSVVLDPAGVVRFRGGIDSDMSHLREGATPYLRDAIDALLTGSAPQRAEAKALGCPLRTR
jgi:hypothetical protein